MADLILSRAQGGRAVTFRSERVRARANVILKNDSIKWIIRYTFYGFIFSLPFEEAALALGSTLPKLFGLALAAFALLQPRSCYKAPPKAFWCFGIYVLTYTLSALYLLLTPPVVPELVTSIIGQQFRLIQLLILFWISYNLMRNEQVIRSVLWVLVAANLVLAVLQILGVTSNVSEQGRVTAFEQNPNGVATVLSLGLLALYGLAYGREKNNSKARLLFWFASAVLAIPVVQTGSRGAVVALAASLAIFFLRGKSLAAKVKFGAIGSLGIIVLAVASYQFEPVRIRWERTFYDESLAGRERIYPEAVAMIAEKPLTGWGPTKHLWELGARLGRPSRDEHNVYLWLLAEVGIVGAVPFFAGLWLCWRAAWTARLTSQGILPLVMLLFILASSMKGTLLNVKYFWVILAYGLASGTYRVIRRKPIAVLSDRTSRLAGNAMTSGKQIGQRLGSAAHTSSDRT